MFKKSSRVLIVTLLLFVLAGSTYAFAAQNTVPSSIAGDGQGDISGYDITDIHYELNDADIETVTFDASNTEGLTATDVKISLVTDGDFFTCDYSGGDSWSCDVSGSVSVLEADLLRVVAVQ
jgi:hypothetical protein